MALLQRSLNAASARSISTMVSPVWLKERLGDVRVLDCSWYLPTMNRSGAEEFLTRRIPGAGFFDIDNVCDRGSPMPHMLPSEDDFAEAVTQLGVSNDTTLVCYDGIGLFTAPRVWWMFMHFGHRDVRVLTGGLPAWIQTGLELDTAPPTKPVAADPPFQCRDVNSSKVWDLSQMTEHKWEMPILDARSAARFSGEAPEPRPGLPSGHIPGSSSVPFNSLLTPDMGSFLPKDELRQRLGEHIQPGTGEVTVTCGSGVTACVVALALHESYEEQVRVNLFDGSWSEYGTKNVLPQLQALLEAVQAVGDAEVSTAASDLQADAPLLRPGLELLLTTIEAKLEQNEEEQQASSLKQVHNLAKALQEAYVS